MAESCSMSSLVPAIFRSLWRCTIICIRILPSCNYLLLPFLVPPPCVEFGLLGFCGFGGCLIFDGPISPKELKLSCGLVLPAAAETPTCFTIWCRFFIWPLTQDTQIFMGIKWSWCCWRSQWLWRLLPSGFTILHMRERKTEVAWPFFTKTQWVLVKNQRRTANSLFILTWRSLETDGTARIKKQRPISVAFH